MTETAPAAAPSASVAATPVQTPKEKKIDESLYSRQLYTLGKEAQGKLAASTVLVVGLRGLGAEIAKNIILMGVKQVSLYDFEPVEMADLVSQFYLNGTDMGKPRAAACVAKFAELNHYVDVNVVSGPLDANLVSRYQVVVLTGGTLTSAVALDRLCLASGVKFLWSDVRGVFCFAFTDFGPKFTVFDADGETPFTYNVASITQDSSAVVTCIEEQRFELEVGARVQLSGVEGMPELNYDKATHPETYLVKSVGRHEIQLECDTSKLRPYTGGGYLTEVKLPKDLAFEPLEKAAVEPGNIEPTDFAKEGRQYQLLLAFRALWKWMDENGGKTPRLRNEDDAAAVLKIAKELAATAKDAAAKVDEELVRQLAHLAWGDLSPMDTFLGGLVSQEVIKACTGKYTPVRQWLLFDAVEVLPELPNAPAAEFAPIGSRYDRQVAVLGRALQQRIEDSKLFVVGAGAIGCEVLKVLAMLGLGCGAQGHVHITDMDVIERSNLSRQFLFRERDVEQLKSKTAADAVLRMNPNLHITSYSLRVGPESESVYNEQFYGSLDGVCTALDNFDARRYVDMQCVAHKKPLIDSGTLGSKGNTQVVVPYETENYGASNDPPEKSIPLCTLHHFPHQIEHCIQWARDVFQGLFFDQPSNISGYAAQGTAFLDALDTQGSGHKLKALNEMQDDLVERPARTWVDCLRWARLLFEDHFVFKIQQLLWQFPPDNKTAEGLLFWSPPKRCPHPLVFDAKDEQHLAFVVAAAKVRAFNFGVESGACDSASVEQALAGLTIPTFKPAAAAPAPASGDASGKESSRSGDGETLIDDDEREAQKLLEKLPSLEEVRKLKVAPAAFEKDDDSNYHMAFVTACSNLRATNYKIPPADFQRTKLIAGKIIPAMISTTAVVSGLQCLELIKALQKKPLKAYKNGFVNLALPLITFSEPIAAPRRKVREGWEWTLWDTVDIKGEITMRELLQIMRDKYKLEPAMISCGSAMIHSQFISGEKAAQRLAMPVSRVVEEVTKTSLPEDRRVLLFETCCTKLEDDQDVDIPPIRYILPPKK